MALLETLTEEYRAYRSEWLDQHLCDEDDVMLDDDGNEFIASVTENGHPTENGAYRVERTFVPQPSDYQHRL